MQNNSNISYTGLVEKYVGTAYDKMAEIHARLEKLLIISASIEDGSFQEVADIADEIQTLIDRVNDFKTTYYGALDYVPTLDPLGDPITDGDLYFDINKELMYVFYRDTWTPLGAIASTAEHIVIGDNHVDGSIITIENLDYPYLPGMNNMAVHRNGELLVSIATDPIYGEYREVDERTIEMYKPTTTDPDRLLLGTEVGDRIVVHIGTEAATVTHVGRVGQYSYTTVVENEAVIDFNKFAPGVNYVVGSLNLSVHLKEATGNNTREYQIVDLDYYETGPTTIQFADPLAQGSEVILTIGHITSSDDAHFEPIMAIGTPDPYVYDPGQLWFKEDTGRLFILYEDDVPVAVGDDPGQTRQWVSTTPEDIVINEGYEPPAEKLPAVIHGTIFQDIAPDPNVHSEGTLWFNISTGNLHIKYHDGDSHQWVKVST